ncbi:MAG: NADP-dependent phosphogluconate dehydrogenase [Maribacter sp.]|nr:NADP-dependent phosphogluconate dehydrogenase [Maribacter sp.]
MVEFGYDFGLVGLGVMGRNFILNVADNGFSAFGHDLDEIKVESLITEGRDSEKINASSNVETFTNSLSVPRKILLLVPAGTIVDTVIESLLPHLDKGDILIDSGNSFFTDTNRREEYLKSKGIHFFGAGISGGARGARLGPSIMPGGSEEAYEEVQPIFEAVAAKFNGEPCVAYLGPKSAGNYVKMVHNGIEYGLMQLTSEIYDILKKLGGFSNAELHEIFKKWNEGRLQSYLVEITSEILKKEDEHANGYLIDKILDKAKQKGTGKWTSQNAMDLGIPIPSIDIAVSMREVSAMKEEREKASGLYKSLGTEKVGKDELEKAAEEALYFGFVLTYAQGFHQLTEASMEYGYEFEPSTIARIWRAGCIIRAGLLEEIATAYSKNKKLSHLLLDMSFVNKIESTLQSARKIISAAIKNGIPLPGHTNSLTYFDAFRSKKLPLNLIQAQRDYFGSHTYERIDREGIFHTEWEDLK